MAKLNRVKLTIMVNLQTTDFTYLPSDHSFNYLIIVTIINTDVKDLVWFMVRNVTFNNISVIS